MFAYVAELPLSFRPPAWKVGCTAPAKGSVAAISERSGQSYHACEREPLRSVLTDPVPPEVPIRRGSAPKFAEQSQPVAVGSEAEAGSEWIRTAAAVV